MAITPKPNIPARSRTALRRWLQNQQLDRQTRHQEQDRREERHLADRGQAERLVAHLKKPVVHRQIEGQQYSITRATAIRTGTAAVPAATLILRRHPPSRRADRHASATANSPKQSAVFGDVGMYIGRVDARTRQPVTHPAPAVSATAARPTIANRWIRRTEIEVDS